MPGYLQSLTVTLILCSGTMLCRAQSLGEVARQQQQKKTVPTQPKPRHIIPDDDLKSSSGSSPGSPTSNGENKNKKSAHDQLESTDSNASSAAEIQERIKEQKQLIGEIQGSIKDIQEQLEQWKTSDCTHVVYAGTSKNTCDLPPKLTAELERTKSQLKTEQANLEEMQEEARHLGYGNSVYDPK
jgi:hypothetical protein